MGSAREVYVSVRVGCGNPKSVWWNNEVKATVKKKEVLRARDEDARERCLEVYKEENRKVKRCIYQSKKQAQEQFGKKRNQDVNRNRTFFYSKGIKDGNGRLALE